jgi:hypothetical protein
MKDKIIKKFKKEKVIDKSVSITSKNIDEHREEILKKGKKFKYPVQYARHKVLINTVIIMIVAAAIFVGTTVFMLYGQQSRNDFFYAIAQIVPVPVAQVDDQPVSYADYLLRLRSSLHYLQAGGSEVDLNSADGAEYVEHIKRQELTEAEKTAFAYKLAAEHQLEVTDGEVDDFIEKTIKTRDASLSMTAFETTVLGDLYGLNLNEFKVLVKSSLLRGKVKVAIDSAAKNRIENLLDEALAVPDNFAEMVKNNSDDEMTNALGGRVDLTLSDSLSDPNGLVAVAAGLEKGAISQVVTGADGYYLVKLNDKNGQDISYSVLKVAFKEFDARFDALKSDGKIKEYINIAEE